MSKEKKNCACEAPQAEHVIDTLDNYVKSERVLNRLLATITMESEMDVVAREVLKIIVENGSADRGYVFAYSAQDGSETASKTHEWVAPDAVDTIEKLPSVESGNATGYRKLLLDHRPVIIEDSSCCVDHLPDETFESLKQLGVKSRLVCGIWIDNALYGFLGLDYVRRLAHFSHCDINIITNAANIFRLSFERARRCDELLESVSLQRQIMDNISIPILLIDLDYRVLAANPTKKVNVDMPLEKLRGTHCYDNVCKFGSPPEFCAVQETMVTKKPAQKEFTFGGKRLISTAQPIFDRNGEMQSVLNLDIDITEVTRQKEELKIAMEQAQAANHAKSYFLATVSHELRTPLNAVIGFSELLQNGGIDEKTQKEYLQSINFAGTALLNLINDVLDLSNLEANQTLIDPVKNDVADLIRQVMSVFTLKGIQKNIRLVVDVAGVTYPLYVDNLRLRQILLNLIGNAIKFTSEGEVAVRAVFTPETDETGSLEISVSDTGTGISPENQKRIFEPFVHDSVIRGKRMYEGSGLGLTITKRLLDKMGGDIRLESALGEGSCFTIRLSNVKYDPTEKIQVPETIEFLPESEAVPSRCDNLRMLIVDDVPLNLKVLEAMLRKLDVECTLAESGEAAIAILRRDRNYDMILTDMWMPNLSGAELAVYIRRELGIGDIPIAAVTADTQISPEDKELFIYLLHKPITIEGIKQMFQTVIPKDRLKK